MGAVKSALLTLIGLGVLAIRYGHVKFPYREDENQSKPYVRE